MSGRFPIAAYARTLSPRELTAFAALPLLRHNPMRAIRVFEKYRRRTG
jgi:hypothetical protein